MIVNNKIFKRDLVSYNVRAEVSFKKLQNQRYHLNRATFNHLIEKTFLNLQDANSEYYLYDNQWLLLAFKKLFQKNQFLLTPIYEIVNNFYKIYPFNLENIFSYHVSNFFKQYSFQKMITDNPDNIKIISEKGINFLAKKIFEDFFISYINKNLQISELKTKYKSFKSLFQNVLKEQIKNILKDKINNFNWSDYKHLNQWINDFDYQNAYDVNVADIYDRFFAYSNNLQKINLKEDDFKEKYLTKYLQKKLNLQKVIRIDDQIPMLIQAFLYYLFTDLIANKQISSVNLWSLKDAKIIKKLSKKVSNGEINSYRTGSKLLEIYYNLFPKIKNFIEKFDFCFKWSKSNNAERGIWIDYHFGNLMNNINYYFGIVIENITLLPIADSKTEFELKLELKFITTAVKNSHIDKQKNIFKIKVVNAADDFQKASQIFKNFLAKKPIKFKKSYFLNASSMTEKDFVERNLQIKSYQDIISPHKNNNEQNKNRRPNSFINWWSENKRVIFLIIKLDLNIDQKKLFLTDLSELNKKLAKINNPHYDFKIRLICNFQILQNIRKEKLFLDDNSYKFILVLTQEPKNSNVKWWEKYGSKINEKHHSIERQKLWFMTNIIQNLIKTKFPKSLNFNFWKNQKRFFWKEEFINKNQQIIDPNAKSVKKNLDKRSNLNAIKAYLQPIITKINQYRNDFTWKYNYKIYEDELTKQKMIKLDLVINDKGTGQQIILSTKSQLMELKNYQSNAMFNFLIFNKPLLKTDIFWLWYKEQKSGGKIADNFTFLYQNQKMSIFDMKQKLRAYGFKNIKHSTVFLETKDNEQRPYINLQFDVPYYNFATRQNLTKTLIFKIYIVPYNYIVTPQQITEKYKSIINSITDDHKKNTQFMKRINGLLSKLGNASTQQWRNDLRKEEFFKITSQIEKLISQFKNKNINKIMTKLQKIYGSNIPDNVLDKALDPAYYSILKEILDQSEKIGNKKIKKILENNKFIDFLKKQKISKVRSFILDFLNTTDKIKYVYFGVGVGFGAVGLLGTGTLWWQKNIKKQSQIVNVKFKKNKYITIITFGATLLSIIVSVVFMLLFFVTKGGF